MSSLHWHPKCLVKVNESHLWFRHSNDFSQRVSEWVAFKKGLESDFRSIHWCSAFSLLLAAATTHGYRDRNSCCGLTPSMVWPENASSCHTSCASFEGLLQHPAAAHFLWSSLFLGWAMFRGLQRPERISQMEASTAVVSMAPWHALVSVLLGLAWNWDLDTLHNLVLRCWFFPFWSRRM